MNATRRRILEFLGQQPAPVYGLDMINAGVGSRYSIFVHMAWLEEVGLVEGVEERVTMRRRYKITDKGRGVLLPVARVR
jgi:predicted transcriptional regulator